MKVFHVADFIATNFCGYEIHWAMLSSNILKIIYTEQNKKKTVFPIVA